MTRRNACLLFVLAAAFPTLTYAAERGEAKARVAGKAVAIDYGRPELKGRDMLAQAEVGRPWRMGKDAATTLKTEADLKFGEVAIPMGDYILTATKLAADKWQLNFANAADRAAVGSVPLSTEKLAGSVETFTIELSGQGEAGELQLKWGGVALKTGFTGR